MGKCACFLSECLVSYVATGERCASWLKSPKCCKTFNLCFKMMVNAWTWTLVHSCHFRLVDEFDAGFASGPTFYIGHQLVNHPITELLIIYK